MKIENVSNKYKKEDNQCLVVALCEVSNIDYDDVYLFVQHVMNRRKGYPVLFTEIEKNIKMILNLGIKLKRLKIKENESIRSFYSSNKPGKYLLFTENHVIAMVEGVLKEVKDYINDLDEIIFNVFKVD